jgi:ethanolamine utilization protein EutJ
VITPGWKTTGADPEGWLARAEEVIHINPDGRAPRLNSLPKGEYHVGVDLGTAYTVLTVLDEDGSIIAGTLCKKLPVRDGLVVDYIGAVDLLRELRGHVEARIGRSLTHAASGFPPGVPGAEVRATANVVEAAGMRCQTLVDEPTAANNVLGLRDGAIVDVGGGTTGIAVLKDGKVIYTADEATGGTHFSLVIAGALDISFEDAEELKKDPSQQQRLFPIVRPVMEKVGVIVNRHLQGRQVDSITLVGGTTLFPGMADVIQEVTGITTHLPEHPLFVTPLGIALSDTQEL